MKDVQGVQRGKCNSCECQEYTTPSTPGKVRCEYCNHTPREHVSVEKPGKCSKCGGCEEYYSEDPSSFTDCQYCGCAASDHNIQAGLGVEKFRVQHESRLMGPPTDLPSTYSQQEMSPPTSYSSHFKATDMPHGSQHQGSTLKHHTYGTQPGMQYGNCIYPGCPFQKYVDREEGKIHDFCSKSCAKNFAEMQASFHKYKITQQIGLGSSGVPHSRHGQSGAPLLISQPIRPPDSQPHSSRVASASGHQTGGFQSGSVGGVRKMCTKCGQNPANPGRGWCQQCYINSTT